MTPLALAALEREKHRRRQYQRQWRERRQQAVPTKTKLALEAEQREKERKREAQAAYWRRRAEAMPADALDGQTIATNIYARTRRTDGVVVYTVAVHPHLASFDDLDEAREWRDRIAATYLRRSPVRLVNLIRAGEALGRL